MKIYDKNIYKTQQSIKAVVLVIVCFLVGFVLGYLVSNLTDNKKEVIDNTNVQNQIENNTVITNEIV